MSGVFLKDSVLQAMRSVDSSAVRSKNAPNEDIAQFQGADEERQRVSKTKKNSGIESSQTLVEVDAKLTNSAEAAQRSIIALDNVTMHMRELRSALLSTRNKNVATGHVQERIRSLQGMMQQEVDTSGHAYAHEHGQHFVDMSQYLDKVDSLIKRLDDDDDRGDSIRLGKLGLVAIDMKRSSLFGIEGSGEGILNAPFMVQLDESGAVGRHSTTILHFDLTNYQGSSSFERVVGQFVKVSEEKLDALSHAKSDFLSAREEALNQRETIYETSMIAALVNQRNPELYGQVQVDLEFDDALFLSNRVITELETNTSKYE
ncbi:hypothetical protein [Polycladidibacter stylochi]|uniref:hypothetical protein n=1 Tax=Polycladidibacter stylochi TaxID=1807766 RepID=UPI00083259ED|nr:hypothetical protein [Pseudovibrio stylochi]